MKPFVLRILTIVGILTLAASLPAATVTFKIEPTTCTTVSPGGTVNYRITGTVSNDGNYGLATFGVDVLTGTGVAQRPANSVTGTATFAPPLGYHPGGFGGKPDANGNLLQIGGAQNTIHNDGISPNPPSPCGSVQTNVGLAPADVVLAVGQITLPAQADTYTISLDNAFAGVLGPGPAFPVYIAEASLTTSSFVVTVGSSPAAVMTVAAGEDIEVYEQQTFSLQATVTNNLGYSPLSYSWAQTAGLPVTLDGAESLDLAGTAPTVNTVEEATMIFAATASSQSLLCAAQGTGSVTVRVRIRGDCWREGDNADTVDVLDLLEFEPAFGVVIGDDSYNALCDFNNDGAVDVWDLLDLIHNFGRTLVAPPDQSQMMVASGTGNGPAMQRQTSLRAGTASADVPGTPDIRDMNVYEALEYTGLMDVYLDFLATHPDAGQ